MGSSRYFVFFYAFMGVLPIIFLCLFAAMYYHQIFLIKLFLFMMSLDLIFFSVIGIIEIFSRNMQLPKNISLKNNIEYDITYSNTLDKNEMKIILGRFNNSKKEIDETEHVIKVGRFTNVLDALLKIKHEKDPTIAVRYSCRMGICGSCGVVVNGKPVLACETNVNEIAENNVVKIEPMKGYPILKDFVTDFDNFFEKHKSIEPSLFRTNNKEKIQAKNFYDQTTDELNKFLPYSYCIMCGLCMDACPVANTNKEFLGPQALSQSYRYYMDSRDEKKEERLTAIDKLTGLWGCEFAGSCSKACPKGVDPASAIQLLKLETIKKYFDINIKNKENDEVRK